MSLLRSKPRHAKPSRTAPVLLAGGMTAAFAVGDAGLLGSGAQAASADDFARLRMCESGGNYATNTGNGFYGAYQFDLRTWHGQGYSGLPSDAAPATQDAAAQSLQSQRGWEPWPSCSRRLGLGSSRASRSRAIPARADLVVALAPTTPPPFLHGNLRQVHGRTFRLGVQMWQARMAARGWDLVPDGFFGPRTARVAARFAAQKGLAVGPGEVNQAVWDAAWALPVN